LGHGSYGRFGNGKQLNKNMPVKVSAGLWEPMNDNTISAGGPHSLEKKVEK
jgi:hypothetical protein